MQAEVSCGTALNGVIAHMAAKRYRAIRKRDRKGADVWGVAAFEARERARRQGKLAVQAREGDQ